MADQLQAQRAASPRPGAADVGRSLRQSRPDEPAPTFDIAVPVSSRSLTDLTAQPMNVTHDAAVAYQSGRSYSAEHRLVRTELLGDPVGRSLLHERTHSLPLLRRMFE